MEQWNKMTDDQKAEWNGYAGFVKGQTFNQTSLYKETQFQRNKRALRDRGRGGRK